MKKALFCMMAVLAIAVWALCPAGWAEEIRIMESERSYDEPISTSGHIQESYPWNTVLLKDSGQVGIFFTEALNKKEIGILAGDRESVLALSVSEVLKALTEDNGAIIRTNLKTLDELKRHSTETQENIEFIMEERSELSSSSFIVASVNKKASGDKCEPPSKEIKKYINREAPNGEAIVYISGPRALITQALAVAARENMSKVRSNLTIWVVGSLLLQYGE